MLFDKEIKKATAKAVGSFAGALGQVPILIFNPNVFSMLFLAAGVYHGARNVFHRTLYKDCEQHFYDVLNSDLYKECLEVYKDYVKDISVMYNDLGFSSDLSACIAYYFSLQTGLLSEDGNYSYETSTRYFDAFCEIMGSRVATGEGCCRHNTSLLTDIINEMGGKAACLPVCSSEFDKVRKKQEATHMVAGLLHDGKKVAFDPTVEVLFASNATISLFSDDCKDRFATTLDGKLNHHLRNNIVFDKYDANSKLKREILACDNLVDVGNVYLDSSVKFIKYFSDFVDFNKEEQPKVKRLAALNKELLWRGDGK